MEDDHDAFLVKGEPTLTCLAHCVCATCKTRSRSSFFSRETAMCSRRPRKPTWSSHRGRLRSAVRSSSTLCARKPCVKKGAKM